MNGYWKMEFKKKSYLHKQRSNLSDNPARAFDLISLQLVIPPFLQFRTFFWKCPKYIVAYWIRTINWQFPLNMRIPKILKFTQSFSLPELGNSKWFVIHTFMHPFFPIPPYLKEFIARFFALTHLGNLRSKR